MFVYGCTVQEVVGIQVIDGVLENITLGLEVTVCVSSLLQNLLQQDYHYCNVSDD